jgi:inner membrane protein COX18
MVKLPYLCTLYLKLCDLLHDIEVTSVRQLFPVHSGSWHPNEMIRLLSSHSRIPSAAIFRAPLLQKPRQPILRHYFHSTPCRKFDLPDPSLLTINWRDAIVASRFFFVQFHDATGIPWQFSIPACTLLLRYALATLTQLAVHKSRVDDANFQPFDTAFKSAYPRVPLKLPRPSGHVGPMLYPKLSLIHWRNAMEYRYQTRRRRTGRFGNLIRYAPLLNIPFWLAMVEGLRAMSGCHHGLIGLITRSLGLWQNETGADSDRQFWGTEYIVDSLATQGPFWCENLMLPDPTGALSCALGLATLYSLRKATASYRKTVFARDPVLEKMTTYGVPAAAAFITLATMQFPSAILLYWVTSSATGSMVNKALSVALPLPPPVKPLTTGFDQLSPPPRWLLRRKKVTGKTPRS